jgi:hypothetical protein
MIEGEIAVSTHVGGEPAISILHKFYRIRQINADGQYSDNPFGPTDKTMLATAVAALPIYAVLWPLRDDSDTRSDDEHSSDPWSIVPQAVYSSFVTIAIYGQAELLQRTPNNRLLGPTALDGI